MVLTGIRSRAWGRLRDKGTPFFAPCSEHQFDIRHRVFIVFVLCVPVGGVVLRSVFVLYFLMVEKAERLLRGQWSAFNIYVLVSSGVSSFLLVFASRGGVSSWRLASFRLCVLFVVYLIVVSRLVFRFVLWLVYCLVSFCFSCRSRGGWRSGRGGLFGWRFLSFHGDGLLSCGVVAVASCFRIPIGSVGRGSVAGRECAVLFSSFLFAFTGGGFGFVVGWY